MNRTEHRQARKQDAYARLVLYLAKRRREWSRLVFMTLVLNCFVFAPTSGLSPGWMPASPLFHSNVQRSFECPRQPACNSALGGPHGRVGAALLPVPVRPRADARPRHLRRRAQLFAHEQAALSSGSPRITRARKPGRSWPTTLSRPTTHCATRSRSGYEVADTPLRDERCTRARPYIAPLAAPGARRPRAQADGARGARRLRRSVLCPIAKVSGDIKHT